MSHVMRLWYFPSSMNAYFKRACAAIQWARCLIFGWTLRLLPYFMCANSEGSGETVRMRRFAWAFAGRLSDKYHNLMSWLKSRISLNSYHIWPLISELLVLEGWKFFPYTYKGEHSVDTNASFLIGSSSNLQITRTGIKSRTRFNSCPPGPLARSDACPPGNQTFTGSIPDPAHSFVEIWSLFLRPFSPYHWFK